MTSAQVPSHDPFRPLRDRIAGVVRVAGAIARQLWQSRRMLIRVNGLISVLTVVGLLVFGRPYFDVSVVILPDLTRPSPGLLSQLSGLASLSGLTGLTMGRGLPPEIYENLLRSESVLLPVLRQRYASQEFADSVDLVVYFGVEPDDRYPPELQRRQQELDLLEEFNAEMLFVSVNRISGVVTATVRMPESRLSADVARTIAVSLDRYIIAKNQDLARETMLYIEQRVREERDSLRSAEDALRAFQQENRTIATSPALELTFARLTRTVELKQAVYVELIRQFEAARIEHLKATPVVNFRDAIEEPVEKSGPRRTLVLFGVTTLTALLSALGVIVGVDRRWLDSTLQPPE